MGDQYSRARMARHNMGKQIDWHRHEIAGLDAILFAGVAPGGWYCGFERPDGTSWPDTYELHAPETDAPRAAYTPGWRDAAPTADCQRDHQANGLSHAYHLRAQL